MFAPGNGSAFLKDLDVGLCIAESHHPSEDNDTFHQGLQNKELIKHQHVKQRFKFSKLLRVIRDSEGSHYIIRTIVKKKKSNLTNQKQVLNISQRLLKFLQWLGPHLSDVSRSKLGERICD